MNDIDGIFNRLFSSLKISNDAEFCREYDVKPATFSNWRTRNSIPYELIFKIIKNKNLSSDYVFMGKENTQNVDIDGYCVKILSNNASAGTDSDIEGINVTDTSKIMYIPKNLFKTPKNEKNLRAVLVKGNSMQPKLNSGDWVIIDISSKFNGDDLYVINFRNIFMVKMLQIKPNGNFFIKSLNPSFDSFEITEETQEIFNIVGRVVKIIS